MTQRTYTAAIEISRPSGVTFPVRFYADSAREAAEYANTYAARRRLSHPTDTITVTEHAHTVHAVRPIR